uniref:FAD-binding PCMH-type domain-containing protein n=1 Tax=Moniliophthora roreri TaxID=221103 RepID=A0A0W0GAH5_MONRR
MLRYALLAILQANLLRSAWAFPTAETNIRSTSAAKDACKQIKDAISSASEIFFPGSKGYERDIEHWSPTNTQKATCSVEPANTKDLGKIIQIIGSTKVDFAVKSGGHNPNDDWSSTTGVQIALYRFNEVSYDDKAGTATIGTGLVWDDVYAVLDPLGVHVAGARVTGIGVGGYTLGGGYSWFANQVGLCIDTVTAFELVKPDGSYGWVTGSSDPDLFFALKGGLNNFVNMLMPRQYSTISEMDT